MIRNPAVAGQFYPSIKEQLLKQIEKYVDKMADKQKAIACMLPHAGYVYSGFIAAQTLSRINIPDNILIIGPNHTGLGPPFSIMTEGDWKTPLGQIQINTPLARNLLKQSRHLKEDIQAHTFEHSLEVQLPFLQYLKSRFSIVPIIASQADLQTYREIAKEIYLVLKELYMDSNTLIIASSDMTHYEPDKIARKKDNEAIQAILELAEDKLLNKIKELDISMCGYVPAIIMIIIAKNLGATKANLIKYQTSGDTTGDYSSVVGYAGIIVN